jgi:RND family efflux transporter MFP subunit
MFPRLSLPGLLAACVLIPQAGGMVGVVEPIREETLAAVVVGRVARIHVREGSEVKAGDLLLELDSQAEKLDLARRRIQLESVVELELARTRERIADSEWRAAQRLRETARSVSQEDLNRRELDARLAASEREQLERREEIEALEVQLAEEQLARRFIRAPGNGIVTAIFPAVGEVADARQPLIHVVDVSRCMWVANLEASVAARLVVGAKVRLRADQATGPVEVEGIVDYVAPVLDAGSGLQLVKVMFDNPARRITPGVTATLLLP